MNKLKLNLDELTVETFQIAGGEHSAQGLVPTRPVLVCSENSCGQICP